MGENKALLKLDGRTLLEIALEKAREVTAAVSIVGPQANFGDDAIEDLFPDGGPLGGIHAGLTHSQSDLNLMLAVDTPLVEARFLQFLLQQARASGADVTLPRTADGYEPLCAVYRRSFCGVAETALKERRYKIDALFPIVSLRVIEEIEMSRFAFNPAMFQNLNTRAEYERAKSRSR